MEMAFALGALWLVHAAAAAAGNAGAGLRIAAGMTPERFTHS